MASCTYLYDRCKVVDEAIRLEEPIKVPLWDLLNIPLDKLQEVVGRQVRDVKDYVHAHYKLGWDMVTARPGVSKKFKPLKVDEDTYVGEWGDVRRRMPLGHEFLIGGFIKREEDLDKFEVPDPYAEGRLEPCREVVKAAEGMMPVVALLHDAFEIPYFMRGMDKLLIDYIEKPQLARRLAEVSIRFNIELAKQLLDEGVVGVVTGDDYCYKSGPFMSPKHFNEFIYPYLKKIVDVVHSKGGWFMKHCDGNIWQIIDKLIDAGIDALNPLEREAGMDLSEVKKRYGGRVCLSGNVDCGHTLQLGKVNDVLKDVKGCIKSAAHGGGYILSTSNSIHVGCKGENLKAMFEAVKRYGGYPRKSFIL